MHRDDFAGAFLVVYSDRLHGKSSTGPLVNENQGIQAFVVGSVLSGRP